METGLMPLAGHVEAVPMTPLSVANVHLLRESQDKREALPLGDWPPFPFRSPSASFPHWAAPQVPGSAVESDAQAYEVAEVRDVRLESCREGFEVVFG